MNTDEELIGGYRLEVGGVEYDKSVQGMIKALQNRISGR
ncbi:F0F1 ATP synthase subunit delta [Ruminococcus sp.]